ncbi:unnamed protein product [Acanthocheilonema viteae]|uniref:Serpin domain-containing protein n=1 Tax=Acanthocheilonema viteae TaxID=6277 RepID=A0A498SVA9_ACAVI|nr:unnamed protein product [Acanthocheilonema viteae]
MKLIELALIVLVALGGPCRSMDSGCGDEMSQAKKMQVDFSLKLLSFSPQNESSLLSSTAIFSVFAFLYDRVEPKIRNQMEAFIAGVEESRLDQGTSTSNSFRGSALCILLSNQICYNKRGRQLSAIIYQQKIFSVTNLFRRAMRNSCIMLKITQIKSEGDEFVKEAAGWLKNEPKHEIKNSIYINFGFSLFFMSKLHYQSNWIYHFTSFEDDFHPTPSTAIRMTMIESVAKFRYCQDKVAQVVSLPLQNEMNMVIFLPLETGLAEFEEQLSGEKLLAYIDSLKQIGDIVVTIPEFEIQKYFLLSKPMAHMGMKSLFSPSINLSSITRQDLSITKLPKMESQTKVQPLLYR